MMAFVLLGLAALPFLLLTWYVERPTATYHVCVPQCRCRGTEPR